MKSFLHTFWKKKKIATIHRHKQKGMPLPSVSAKKILRLKFPKFNNLLTEAVFVNKIMLLDLHWNGLISHKDLMHFYVWWLNYSSMLKVRVMAYLFPINYMRIKHTFFENLKLATLFCSNNHFSCKFWYQLKFDSMKNLPANLLLKGLKGLITGSIKKMRDNVTHSKLATFFESIQVAIASPKMVKNSSFFNNFKI